MTMTPLEKTHAAWVSQDRRTWVVHYPETRTRREYWQAYRAVQPVPENRAPWSIDNRRLGDPDFGYPSLQAAISAAEGA